MRVFVGCGTRGVVLTSGARLAHYHGGGLVRKIRNEKRRRLLETGRFGSGSNVNPVKSYYINCMKRPSRTSDTRSPVSCCPLAASLSLTGWGTRNALTALFGRVGCPRHGSSGRVSAQCSRAMSCGRLQHVTM